MPPKAKKGAATTAIEPNEEFMSLRQKEESSKLGNDAENVPVQDLQEVEAPVAESEVAGV